MSSEPLYNLNTRTWDKTCPCILQEQTDPECQWHGRPEFREDAPIGHIRTVRYRYERAGIVYPINWDEMGSSEKDLWEARMLPTVETIEREHSWEVE